MLNNKNILLIISGGIAAYKSLDLIRLIKKSGGHVRCILTEGGSQFVTPLSVSALSGEKCYIDLFNLTDEAEMGHIRLSREADIILVAPASADIIAKMAHGLCNDLATTCLLAADKPVIIAPAMNHMMWAHPATRENIETLQSRGVQILEPAIGDMACGETGQGRMQEPEDIVTALTAYFEADHKPLSGKTAIVTSGPTYEPIDPVRFLGNRSSGKQGHAIACALRDAGAAVTLVSGPTSLPDPTGMTIIHVETAQEMLEATQNTLPADIAVCAAAVADYRVVPLPHKHKKSDGSLPLTLSENPDILKTLSTHQNRPAYVVGFAAETDNLITNAKQKILSKGCDAIVANEVSDGKVFGRDMTSIHIITKTSELSYNDLSKSDAARMITNHIIDNITNTKKENAA